uniref:Conserved oligomeric Golgi complex subunit 3 N-terminal domain-containing protein n=1 Tax=Homalodisca liturata TaxID=320908 RepID=A0A1B6H8V7_9HEMI
MSDSISKDVYAKIHNWESTNDSLAPLSNFQRNVILDLSDEVSRLLLEEDDFRQPITNELKKEDSDKDALNFNILGDSVACIESTSQFLQWYSSLEKEWVEDEDLVYTNYCKQLAERKEECSQLLTQVESSLNHLNELNKEYRQVTNRTNSLHQVSEQLLADQMKLSDINNAVSERLHQFKVLGTLVGELLVAAL